MAEPITHRYLDLYARIADEEHVIGQAKIPVYVELTNSGETLRDALVFTVGDPVVTAVEGWDAKATKARQKLEEWKSALLGELNPAPAAETKGNGKK